MKIKKQIRDTRFELKSSLPLIDVSLNSDSFYNCILYFSSESLSQLL